MSRSERWFKSPATSHVPRMRAAVRRYRRPAARAARLLPAPLALTPGSW